MTTIAARRIDYLAREAKALGAKVDDETREDGTRLLYVHGPHWADRDAVHVRYTPASAKGRKGSRDSLSFLRFSTRHHPRKGYGPVDYFTAVSTINGLKDYSEHTHCEMGRHYCQEPRCAFAMKDGRPCKAPQSFHNHIITHHLFKEG